MLPQMIIVSFSFWVCLFVSCVFAPRALQHSFIIKDHKGFHTYSFFWWLEKVSGTDSVPVTAIGTDS